MNNRENSLEFQLLSSVCYHLALRLQFRKPWLGNRQTDVSKPEIM